MSFVHLHCHSEYSLLDGANRIDDLIARAVEFEQPALAITDHGNLHAAWEFQEKRASKVSSRSSAWRRTSRRAIAARARAPRPATAPYYHLVLLARDRTGYKNLIKLSSLAYTEGFYGKPRVDRELLAKYNEGIIVSSACMAGEVARAPPRGPLRRGARGRRVVRRTSSRTATTSRCRRTTRASRRSSTARSSSSRRSWACRSSPPTTRTSCRRRGPRRARRPALHRPEEGPPRRRPDQVRPRPLLQERARDPPVVSRPSRRAREHARDRRRGGRSRSRRSTTCRRSRSPRARRARTTCS